MALAPAPTPDPLPGPSPGSLTPPQLERPSRLCSSGFPGARRGGGTRGQGQAAGGAVPPCPADPREPLLFRPVPSEGVLEP